MYFVEKTTARERIVIANAIYAPLCDLERAHRLICAFWDDYLGDKAYRPKIAKQLQAAKAVHDARDAIFAKYGNQRTPDAVMGTIRNAFSLPDDQAVSLLQTIEKSAAADQA